jgi:hypothetical protein
MLVGVLATFLVIILILYLINMLPLDGRARQICRVIVIILGVLGQRCGGFPSAPPACG